MRQAVHKFGNIFEWNLVEKAQFIFWSSCVFGFVVGTTLLSIEVFTLLPEDDLNAQSVVQVFVLSGVYGVIAFCLYLLGYHVKKRSPNSRWYALLSIQVYCIANTIILYYLGLFSLGTGVALAGGPIAGMILFPPRLIFYGLFTGIGGAIILIALTALGKIPYAPLLLEPGTAHQNAAWLIISGFYVAPHLVLIVGVAIISILKWKERERKVKFLSRTDVLTNIANRRHLMDLFEKDMDSANKNNTTVSFLMVDLDNFKKINDTYGHQHGDHVIQAAAQALQQSIRQVDHIGRYGGEEFGIILPNTSPIEAIEIAERCRENIALSQVLDDENHNITMTASIGVATSSPRNLSQEALIDEIEHLLKLSDNALYEAKESGRNRVVSHPTRKQSCKLSPVLNS